MGIHFPEIIVWWCRIVAFWLKADEQAGDVLRPAQREHGLLLCESHMTLRELEEALDSHRLQVLAKHLGDKEERWYTVWRNGKTWQKGKLFTIGTRYSWRRYYTLTELDLQLKYIRVVK